MNRIYFGKISSVEIPNGRDSWEKISDSDSTLWRHHQFFQDAVNYYTLALAAMAAGLKPDSAKGRAILEWRDKVVTFWLTAERKAIEFAGPHKRLAGWLGANSDETDAEKAFTACAKALLKKSPASPEALAKALLQLLEEADQSDLNQFCVSRLPWLCTAHGKLDATPKNVAQKQESRMLAIIREIHEATENQIHKIADKLELGWFVTQMPKESMSGAEARAEAERLFKSASVKAKELAAVADKFSKQLDRLAEKLKLPILGRKPKGAYPLAVVFKLFPSPETWQAFKSATESLRKKADKLKESPVEISRDFIADARTADDRPVFDYFTNRILVREAGNEDRAVWFDFDLAAFIEAIKSPHRYFQDTLVREQAAAKLREKLHAIDPDEFAPVKITTEKKKTAEPASDTEDEIPNFTFTNDKRIVLLKKLVREELVHLAEVENPDTEKPEYTIQERTLRGWPKIREEWRKLAEKEKATADELWKVVKAEQGEHREDFGSAPLFQKLCEPKFHPIWLEDGAEKNHADDPLQAWLQYNELQFELKDKERPIRFTPAHAVHSPRYFIIPKVGKFGSQHENGVLSFTTGLIREMPDGLNPSLVRIHYSAPRLHRDELRANDGENLESTNWLQPMMKALGLPEHDVQDFSNCRVILQSGCRVLRKHEIEARKKQKQPLLKENGVFVEYNHQLTFPVEVISDKLVAGIGKASMWARQFNQFPDGDKFYDATLRWPHEKQPAKPPPSWHPWHKKLDTFSCLAVDLGQRDAGAYSLILASANAQKDFGEKPSRFIGETSDGAAKKRWRAALIASGMLRLSGEDRVEWRAPSKLEKGESEFAWRQELFGERGRSATPEETEQCAKLFSDFGIKENNLLPIGWRALLSFPEQNDKLLLAARRAQWRISRLHRWCWFLADEKKRGDALKEIQDSFNAPAERNDHWLPNEIGVFAKTDNDPRLDNALAVLLRDKLKKLPNSLESLANRILPLRKRSWKWEAHPKATKENRISLLTQNGPALPNVLLRGQRGLSLERIEQIEELRRRFQSLNQTLRRDIAGKPPIRRDEIPDSCPDLLEKLDRLKKQRVYQTAHMILAQALGVRLAEPPTNKATLREDRDQHGVYEKFREPADFIVIENLSRYRASQGRAPRENSRLMKWCHRAIRDKLRELCEPFGIPVLETPAAWSSRFCSRSGVAGFRAVELHPKSKHESPWSWHLKRLKLHRDNPEEHPLSEDSRQESEQIEKLFSELDKANKNVGGDRPKWRTLYAPKTGGPIFVPICDRIAQPDHEKLQPAITQADINAAINLGLRAISDPRLWSIHPRLRTQRDKDGAMLGNEKRKFGEKAKVKIAPPKEDQEISATNRNPNFFADVSRKVLWGHATVDGHDQFPLVSGKALWSEIKKNQWNRINEINRQRMQSK